MLLGQGAVDRLSNSCVAIFGVGGVGGYVVEGLARSGVGSFILIDHDVVSLSNLNRQIIALHSTVGKKKVEVAKDRILDINPTAKVRTYDKFYLPGDDEVNLDGVDYIVDAVDTVSAKIEIIMQADKLGIPVISSMGAGNKTDAAAFEVADIYETSVCPLARVMRRELKKRGVRHLKVVYSKEPPRTPIDDMAISCRSHCICPPGTARKCTQRRQVPGSNAFVPATAGLIIAGEVDNDLTGIQPLPG